jgi:AraC-like DNA-binding protein
MPSKIKGNGGDRQPSGRSIFSAMPAGTGGATGQASTASGTDKLLSIEYVRDFFGRDHAHSLIGHTGLTTPQNPLPSCVSHVHFWQLCRADLDLRNDEGHGCTSMPLPRSTGGMLFAAVNEMDTVGEGLRQFAELLQVIPSGVTVQLTYTNNEVLLHYETDVEHPGSQRSERFLELLALVFHCILRWGTARIFAPVRISASELLDSRDGSLLTTFSESFQRRGSGVTVHYDRAILGLPLGVRKYQREVEPEITVFREIAMRDEGIGTSQISDTIVQLRHLLSQSPLSEQCAADIMGISVATLRRRLAHAGTSFRRFSQDLRRRKLESLLAAGVHLDDIASELGFSDRRSLWRACNQWLGMSPSQYRKQHSTT